MLYKIRDFIRRHFIGYRPTDMPCIDYLDYLESKGEGTMKIIELLNKIANGEAPKKIKYDNNLYIYEEQFEDYYCEEKGLYLMYKLIGEGEWKMSFALNIEVEIIEEDKKDEEIEIYFNGKKVDITDIFDPLKQGEYFYKENGKWYVHRLKNVSKIIEEDKKIEKLPMIDGTANILLATNQTRRKINEIIDYINKEE